MILGPDLVLICHVLALVDEDETTVEILVAIEMAGDIDISEKSVTDPELLVSCDGVYILSN